MTIRTQKTINQVVSGAVIAVVLVGLMALSASMQPQIVEDVKTGKVTLECQFHDGWRTVPADKVVGLDDMSSAWLFTNGSAQNCETY